MLFVGLKDYDCPSRKKGRRQTQGKDRVEGCMLSCQA